MIQRVVVTGMGGVTAFGESWAWSERRWSQVTEDTGVGDPSAATAEKGAQLLEMLGTSIGKFFLDLCTADLNDMYTSED